MEAEKRSEGRLKVEYHHSGTLIPAKDKITGLQAKIADMGTLNQAYMPAQVPLSTVARLPGIAEDVWPVATAFAELMKMPELKAELGQWDLMYLSPWALASYGVWTKEPVHSIADLKGMKLMAVGEHAPVVAALGAVPVSVVSTESYTALQRGTVDGNLGSSSYCNAYKWYEIAKYFYALPIGAQTLFSAINIKSWEKLPTDIQQMFIDLHDEACRNNHEVYQIGGEELLKTMVAEHGVKVTEASAEDIALLKKACEDTVWKDWAEKMNEQNLPGQKVLDNWMKLNEKYAELNPFKK